MKVKDIMKTPVRSVQGDASLCEAVAILSSTGYSALPVVDADGRLIGILSEHDVIQLLLPTYEEITTSDAALLDPTLMQTKALQVRGRTVESAMTKAVMALGEDDTILKAAATMISRRIKRMPVVRDGKPVGIVSRIDVVNAVLQGGM